MSDSFLNKLSTSGPVSVNDVTRLMAKHKTIDQVPTGWPQSTKGLMPPEEPLQDPWVDPVTALSAGFGGALPRALGRVVTEGIKALAGPVVSGLASGLMDYPVGALTEMVGQKYPKAALPANIALGLASGLTFERLAEEAIDNPQLSKNILFYLLQNEKGIFGNAEIAKNVGKTDDVELAKLLKSQGESDKMIYEKTGVWFNPFGEIRLEVPDNDLYFNPEFARSSKTEPIKNVLDHPSLQKAIPDAFKELIFLRSPKYKSGEGSFDPTTNTIHLSKKPTSKELVHELNHYVQDKLGMSTGGSAAVLDRLGYDDPYSAYNRLYGEAESRLASERMNLSDDELKSVYPGEQLESMLSNEGLLQKWQDPKDILINYSDKLSERNALNPIENSLAELNQADPTHKLKFDGIQEGFGTIPSKYQITPQDGPAKGATFLVDDPTQDAISKRLLEMIAMRTK